MLKLQEGQLDEAGQEFDAEFTTHPHDSRARYNLAFVFLTQQKFDEAIDVLHHRVIRHKPEYAGAHYSLGKALLQQGLLTEGIKHLEKAVRLEPAKVFVHYQLGRTYVRAGRQEEARGEFLITQKLKDHPLSPADRRERTNTLSQP